MLCSKSDRVHRLIVSIADATNNMTVCCIFVILIGERLEHLANVLLPIVIIGL